MTHWDRFDRVPPVVAEYHKVTLHADREVARLHSDVVSRCRWPLGHERYVDMSMGSLLKRCREVKCTLETALRFVEGSNVKDVMEDLGLDPRHVSKTEFRLTEHLRKITRAERECCSLSNEDVRKRFIDIFAERGPQKRSRPNADPLPVPTEGRGGELIILIRIPSSTSSLG
jgi:hypothetical protein